MPGNTNCRVGHKDQLLVNGPIGASFTLNVNPDDLVRDVKAMCASKIKVPARIQRLVCAGKELVDGDITLSSAGVCGGSNLEIKIAVAGGAAGDSTIEAPSDGSGGGDEPADADAEASESDEAVPVSVTTTRRMSVQTMPISFEQSPAWDGGTRIAQSAII